MYDLIPQSFHHGVDPGASLGPGSSVSVEPGSSVSGGVKPRVPTENSPLEAEPLVCLKPGSSVSGIQAPRIRDPPLKILEF